MTTTLERTVPSDRQLLEAFDNASWRPDKLGRRSLLGLGRLLILVCVIGSLVALPFGVLTLTSQRETPRDRTETASSNRTNRKPPVDLAGGQVAGGQVAGGQVAGGQVAGGQVAGGQAGGQAGLVDPQAQNDQPTTTVQQASPTAPSENPRSAPNAQPTTTVAGGAQGGDPARGHGKGARPLQGKGARPLSADEPPSVPPLTSPSPTRQLAVRKAPQSPGATVYKKANSAADPLIPVVTVTPTATATPVRTTGSLVMADTQPKIATTSTKTVTATTTSKAATSASTRNGALSQVQTAPATVGWLTPNSLPSAGLGTTVYLRHRMKGTYLQPYVGSDSSISGIIRATATGIGPHEQMDLVSQGSDVWAIRVAATGQYWCLQSGSSAIIRANSDGVGSCGRFRIFRFKDGVFGLNSAQNGQFLTVEPDYSGDKQYVLRAVGGGQAEGWAQFYLS